MLKTFLLAIDTHDRLKNLRHLLKMANPSLTIDHAPAKRDTVLLRLSVTRYDAVVLEDAMPYVTELMEAIRSSARFAHTNIILMRTLEEPIHAAPDAYLSTPLSMNDIRALLERIPT